MAVTGTYTNREICTDALRKIGVVALDETATAEEIETARTALDRLLKSWQNRDIEIWTKASQTVTLTTSASYTLDPVRPLSIDNVNLKRSGIETPMCRMTRDEYDTLPDKTSTGLPTQFYYDRQRESALLYIWPVLSSASGETLEITYTREIEDVVLTEAADVPGEWYDAVVYGLASRLIDDFGIGEPKASRIMQRAAFLEDEALGFDREESVFFAGEY